MTYLHEYFKDYFEDYMQTEEFKDSDKYDESNRWIDVDAMESGQLFILNKLYVSI